MILFEILFGFYMRKLKKLKKFTSWSLHKVHLDGIIIYKLIAMDVSNKSFSFDLIAIYRSKGMVLLNHVDLSIDVSSIIVIEYRHLGKAGDR